MFYHSNTILVQVQVRMMN